ncbi:MAG: aminopeptidase [Chloroflexi bacterium]|nr:aminopeptidase [Chloroflexota bacterium]
MRLRVVIDQPWDVPADVLVVPIVGEASWDGALGELDRRAGGELRALQAFGELRSKQFTSSLAASGDVRAGRILMLSVGPADQIDRETMVHSGAAAMHRLAGRHATSMAFWLEPLIATVGGDAETLSALIARGVVEGGYDPATIYCTNVRTAPPVLDELILVAPAGSDVPALTAAADRGQIIGEGANIARTLSNRAANDVSPEVLAEEAWAIAEKHGLWIDVLGPDRAIELGMGMFMAVGRGSDNPPRMIVMRSGKPGQRDALDRHLALVGKGVCFDSGGISIKPSHQMEEMKMDKSGACTVIAAIATVARLAPGTPLLALAPAVENMPGSHSSHPGDLVKAMNGKWVDITNTDAEGRLILGDAMTYAEQLGATHLVDIATLTGSVSRALGDMVAGAFGNEQAWTDQVLGAGARAGERYWQLPLVEDYWIDMESWYGDMVNSDGAEGGLVKSALFLREFTTRPWVHLDVAGTAYFRKTKPFAPRGATGASHATLVELALAGARPG